MVSGFLVEPSGSTMGFSLPTGREGPIVGSVGFWWNLRVPQWVSLSPPGERDPMWDLWVSDGTFGFHIGFLSPHRERGTQCGICGFLMEPSGSTFFLPPHQGYEQTFNAL